MFCTHSVSLAHFKTKSRSYFAGTSALIVPSPHRICSRKDARPRVQDSCNSRFGDRNRLLLHSFMDGDAILVSHLIEFIDTHNSSIGQDHGSTLEIKFSLEG